MSAMTLSEMEVTAKALASAALKKLPREESYKKDKNRRKAILKGA